MDVVPRKLGPEGAGLDRCKKSIQVSRKFDAAMSTYLKTPETLPGHIWKVLSRADKSAGKQARREVR
jgi:hypothetical protein